MSATRMFRKLEARLGSDGPFSIGRVVDDADEFRGRALDVIDGPGVALPLFGWSIGHGVDRATSIVPLRALPGDAS